MLDESDAEARELRPAIAQLDRKALLPAAHLQLLRWAADYYQYPIGEALFSGIPRALKEGKALPETAWRLTLRAQGLPDQPLPRAPRQAEVLARLREQPVLEDRALREQGISTAVLRELKGKGLIERCAPQPVTPSPQLRQNGPALTAEQTAAIAALDPDGGFSCHLLDGVTGSGKTEVYLQLIAACLAAGKQALVLVPEIGLTPQTLGRFRERFAAPIAVLHSGLSDGQRLEAWLAARNGSAGVLIGTRSAILAPLARPGMVIVDEEHDGSYKQQDGFRYSARDVAVKRAQLQHCPVLLGSATPSLESVSNSLRGRYRHHRLRNRAAGGAFPSVETVDLRSRPLQAGFSDTLLNALKDCTEVRGEQALLFLNRRGYAPTLQCHDCGWVAGCSECDARLTVHMRRRQLRCHHCAERSPLPPRCPRCGGQLLTRGLGTEQSEEFLRRELNCPVLRVDSDSVSGPRALEALLAEAHRGEPCVLLGTQMLTKGHHFPRVQLVGIIDADALLFSADFRGEERCVQLLAQVAGRAGRERAGARVLVQTHHPQHPLLQTVPSREYLAAAEPLLAQRKIAGLPPYGQLSLLRCDCREEAQGEAFLTAIRRAAESELPPGTQLVGPLPSAMPRRAGRYRSQLWCLSADRRGATLANARLVAIAETLPRRGELNWFMDIDPQDVL